MGNDIRYSSEVTEQFVKYAIDYVGAGVVITDPSLPDNPIIYTNKGFEELTGYPSEEIIGHNCRFLQGEDTRKEDVAAVRDAIRDEKTVVVELKNYRKNGEMFWNELEIYPIYLESEQKNFFVGVQKDVTQRKRNEELVSHYLEEVTRLSTPIVPITDTTSILPLIGDVDDRRLNQILERVGEHVQKSGERNFLLDLQGISRFHSGVHNGVLRLHQLLDMMGTRLIVTGFHPKMAMESVRQADFSDQNITFYASVKQALTFLEKEENR
ncbi:biphenyl 2,3-dioxygenase [Terribacillus saccharophilus]|uniref:PAS domain-containing protein n=1 Tax=Terribacillus saccharophilus TaxID=361277 RepID=UPI000BA6266D|nr:STAS domain-containing protein [Terribacillus saccharophilus]PAF37109.1 biphenyl 2,3-dioxygenase [Terribacillus saccharophilus]